MYTKEMQNYSLFLTKLSDWGTYQESEKMKKEHNNALRISIEKDYIRESSWKLKMAAAEFLRRCQV